MENEAIVTSNDIFISNIKWWKKHTLKNKVNFDELPETYQISIPNNMLEMYKKNYKQFCDEIETFCYNFLAKKFNVEVSYCQIWLPSL